MKKLLIVSLISMIVLACNNTSEESTQPAHNSSAVSIPNTDTMQTPGGNPPAYDANRGSGKYAHVDVDNKLNIILAGSGEKLYNIKCAGCHKVSDEKLVGPGWKGVTTRHKPEWIMNFVTNTDEMLNKDPKAQAQLEICLVRMPDQNLVDKDARSLLEFMRKIDGVK